MIGPMFAARNILCLNFLRSVVVADCCLKLDNRIVGQMVAVSNVGGVAENVVRPAGCTFEMS